MKIKKIETNQQTVSQYISQNNVIRNTTRNTTTRFGKIVISTDSDADG